MKLVFQLLACLIALTLVAPEARAQTFFFTGPAGGDFFDEANWNDMADGSGLNPVGDLIPDDSTGAIALDLIVDGDSVVAAGQVDFGTGSLSLLGGASLDMTAAGSIIDFNADSTFTLTDSTLIADDDVVMEGVANLTGGSITSVNDDVEFQDALTVNVDGTSFSAGDNAFFDAFSGSFANATITSADRLGLRQNAVVVVTDTMIDVQGGNGDVDDVFDAAGAGSSLTLLGASTLLADTVEEGVDLIIGDSSIAILGGNGTEILDNDSTATLLTVDAMLQVNEITDDPRAFIINGLTGQSYADDSSTWNVTNWNGTDAVTLQIVPEPSTALLLAASVLAFVSGRRTV